MNKNGSIGWTLFTIVILIVLFSWIAYGRLIPPQVGQFIHNIRGNTIEIPWTQLQSENLFLKSYSSCYSIDLYRDFVAANFIYDSCSKYCRVATVSYSCSNSDVICNC